MVKLHRRHYIQLKSWGSGSALLASFCFGSMAVVESAQRDTSPIIVVNPGRYTPYYHMAFNLTAPVIDFSRTDRSASPGGQFTVSLHPAGFPVSAPFCRGDLILRMPWTAPNVPEAAMKIATKVALLHRILELEQRPDAIVPVVLELNPYVRTISRTPLLLQLTQCNLFFRQVLGAYINDTEARQGA
jgi:hypothetical protein